MTFSILIPTLKSRDSTFRRLLKKLERLVAGDGLTNEVEIIYLSDSGESSIGNKRNRLMEMAKGDFTAFIDDDDDVSDDYVKLIYRAITEHPGIDCIGIRGIVTFRGRSPHTFIHSLRYRDYFSKGKTLFRPPYHLNPIRREIALRYRFEDTNYSEDIDWAMRMLQDNALQSEYFIDETIYFYNSRRHPLYQFLIDFTEPVRHAMGLRLSNRFRVKRKLKLD